MKKSDIFLSFRKKKKIELQNLGFIFIKSQFKENIKIIGAHLVNQLSSRAPTYIQTFRGVCQPKVTKKCFKIKKKVPKFCAFRPPGIFGNATAKHFWRYAWNFAWKSQYVWGIFVPNFSFQIKQQAKKQVKMVKFGLFSRK